MSAEREDGTIVRVEDPALHRQVEIAAVEAALAAAARGIDLKLTPEQVALLPVILDRLKEVEPWET